MNLQNLEKFALDQIHHNEYPQDHYTFRMFGCPDCGAVPLALTVEHHTGSSDVEFRGKIFAECSKCKKTSEVFSFTGDHRKPEHRDTSACECGNKTFFAGQGERFSSDEEIVGFAEEGIVVGQCGECNVLKKILVWG